MESATIGAFLIGVIVGAVLGVGMFVLAILHDRDEDEMED